MGKKGKRATTAKKAPFKDQSKQKEVEISPNDIETVKGMLDWNDSDVINLLKAFGGSVDTAVNAVFDGKLFFLYLFCFFCFNFSLFTYLLTF